VSTTGLVDAKQPKRRQYSEALKRQMVAETQAPGASVSIVARRHDVNSIRPSSALRGPSSRGRLGAGRLAPPQQRARYRFS
jgi:transposase-like protein